VDVSGGAALRHTPYDGSRRPFTVGLEPLKDRPWLEPDARLLPELAQKDQLFATRRAVVFRAEPGTEAAQDEVLALVADHVARDHPALYRLDGAAMLVAGARRVALDDAAVPALHRAAMLVQDDLVLMRRGPDGWRLAAASLCFPSTWSLAEKFSQPMAAIHARVPHYAQRMSATVDRIFDNLKVAIPVWRLNWSLYDDDALHHPEPKRGMRAWNAEGAQFADSAFIRVERQTLRRLPASGDILFTIRVYLDPVAALRAHPEGRALAAGLLAQLLALDAAELAYKGLTAERERIAAALSALR
jgi:dimethylamine monooxygenase subunit A